MSPDGSAHESAPDRGFTLPELLVVIVILGILATITVFAVSGVSDTATDTALAADAQVIETAEGVHFAQFGHYATEEELVGAGLIADLSDLHDIEIDVDGRYRLTRTSLDRAGESAVTPDVVAGDSTTDATTTTTNTTTTEAMTSGGTPSGGTTAGSPATNDQGTTTTAATTTTTPATITTTPAPSGMVTCAFTVTSAWDSGGNGDLVISNRGDRPISAWTVSIDQGAFTIELWNASRLSGAGILARNLSWNGSVAAGASSTVTGGSISGTGLSVGQTFGCRDVTPKPSTSDLACTFTLGQVWDTGGNGTLRIDNNGPIPLSDWTVSIARDGATFAFSSATIASTTADRLTLSNQSHNGSVTARGSASPTTASVSRTGLTSGQRFSCTVDRAG